MSTMLEHLEARQMMSATPTAPIILSAAVQNDRAAILVQLRTFTQDFFNSYAPLLRDVAEIKYDLTPTPTALAPITAQLNTDMTTIQISLLADNLSDNAIVQGDLNMVAVDSRTIVMDGGNTKLLVAAQTKFGSDESKLQKDMLAQLDARIATRQMDMTKVLADADAFLDIAATGDAKDAAAVNQMTSDVNAFSATATADLTKIKQGRAQLAADFSAMVI